MLSEDMKTTRMLCPWCNSTDTATIIGVAGRPLKYPMGLCKTCDWTWVIGGRRHKRTRQRGGR